MQIRIPAIFLILASVLLVETNSGLGQDINLQGGTSIVAIYRSRRLLVATDSKRGFIDPARRKDPESIVCKINKLSDSLFFTGAGITVLGSHDKGDFFQYDNVIRDAYRETPGVFNAIETADKRLKSALEQSLITVREKAPKTYEREFSRNLANLSVIFFGAHLGHVFLHRRDFKATNHPSEVRVDISSRSCPNSRCNVEPHVVLAGKFKAISEYEKRTHIPDSLREEAKWVNDALNTQIKSTPNDVGPPVRILSIKPTGEREWIQGQKGCGT